MTCWNSWIISFDTVALPRGTVTNLEVATIWINTKEALNTFPSIISGRMRAIVQLVIRLESMLLPNRLNLLHRVMEWSDFRGGGGISLAKLDPAVNSVVSFSVGQALVIPKCMQMALAMHMHLTALFKAMMAEAYGLSPLSIVFRVSFLISLPVVWFSPNSEVRELLVGKQMEPVDSSDTAKTQSLQPTLGSLELRLSQIGNSVVPCEIWNHLQHPSEMRPPLLFAATGPRRFSYQTCVSAMSSSP